jgi:hypothetical protein
MQSPCGDSSHQVWLLGETSMQRGTGWWTQEEWQHTEGVGQAAQLIVADVQSRQALEHADVLRHLLQGIAGEVQHAQVGRLHSGDEM